MSQIEDERKFAIDKGQRVPDLNVVADLGAPDRFTLTATYVDTIDLALARAKIVLRRRTGGHDEGWHLKLPGTDGARVEHHAPLEEGPSPAQVPASLRTRVEDIVDRQALVPVAVVKNLRTERELRLGDTVLALLCDDSVTATTAGKERSWRELEVELVDGDRAMLERVTEIFAQAGIAVSDSPSKLATILGDPTTAEITLSPGSPAVDVMRSYWADQVGTIQSLAEALRTDEFDAVHKVRVACRRLRSSLRTWRPLLKRDRADRLRDELRWFGLRLGGPRDAEVLREHLVALLDELPADAIAGPVRERVTSTLDDEHRAAHAKLLKTLDGRRFAALMTDLTRLLTDPPVRSATQRKAKKVLPGLLQKASGRANAAWKQSRALDGEERMIMLHETRKKAKAARYGAEALAPAFGDDATAWATAWEQVTETFGVLQDSVVAVDKITDIAAAAGSAGEPRSSYRELIRAERARGKTAQADGKAAVKTALGLHVKRWS